MAISGQHAEILVAVADAGSFLKAATVLGVTQPTLSRIVADLEDELGFKLFVRHARGVRPTPEGSTLIAPARRVVSAVHGLERAARATRETSGTLRLTTSEYIGIEVLVPRLPQFYDQHPNVSVEFVLNNTSTDLRRGEADLAIRLYRPTQEDLVVKHLVDVPVALFAARSYIEKHGVPTTFEEALTHKLVGFDPQGPLADVMKSVDPRLNPEVFAFRTDSLAAQLAAVRSGVGLTVLQRPHAARFPELVEVEIGLTFGALELWTAVHEDMRDAAVVRAGLAWAEQAIHDYARV
ncbi:MAG: LysR family transcriptional regulator [bacterium]